MGPSPSASYLAKISTIYIYNDNLINDSPILGCPPTTHMERKIMPKISNGAERGRSRKRYAQYTMR